VRVLLPLPDRDFDVTEVAVPWVILRDAGHQVTRTCSAAPSATCSNLNDPYPERTGLSALSTAISPRSLAAFPPR